MKKDNLIFYAIPYNTEAWRNFRLTGISEKEAKQYKCNSYAGGIGSSECTYIMREYPIKDRPIIQDFFYYKIGMNIPPFEPSELMIHGLETEEMIKNRWRCYAGENDWLERYIKWNESKSFEKTKYILRNARRINKYVVNKKYNWLFSSFDFWADKYSFNIITGEPMEYGFPIETKDTSYYYVGKYKENFPRSFNIQVHQEMIVSNSEYCEVAMFIDRKFKVVPIERDKLLVDEILDTTHEFWQSVLKAREYLKLRNEALEKNNKEKAEEYEAYISSLEPAPDDTESYKDYFKERFQIEQEKVKGDLKHFQIAKLYKAWGEIMKLAKNKQQFQKNKLLKLMLDEKAERIDFEDMGYVQGSPKFYNGIKEEFDKNIVENEFDKIEL
jgi:hypothetical protein